MIGPTIRCSGEVAVDVARPSGGSCRPIGLARWPWCLGRPPRAGGSANWESRSSRSSACVGRRFTGQLVAQDLDGFKNGRGRGRPGQRLSVPDQTSSPLLRAASRADTQQAMSSLSMQRPRPTRRGRRARSSSLRLRCPLDRGTTDLAGDSVTLLVRLARRVCHVRYCLLGLLDDAVERRRRGRLC